ncbi:hypothetical protein V8E51_019275 [Hyaloscypha variabilis]
MEAVAALSVACNVMQVISFAHETISLCKRLHQGGLLDEDLANNARHLSSLSASLRDSINAVQTSRPLTKEQNGLQAVAERCLEASTKLRLELDKFTMPGSPSGLTTLKNVLSAHFHKKSIEALRKIMNECQCTLQSDLLFQLWNSNEIEILEQRQDWQKLHRDAQLSVHQNAEGHRQTSELVSAESFSTRLQISSEGAATRAHMETSIHNLSHGAALEKQCDRLIGSLKHRDMNARRNHVSDSHESTFQWIFDDSMELHWKFGEGVKRPWDSFMEWLKSDQRLYWINGKAGSGKSTLMKFIVDDPRTKDALELWNPQTSIVAVFIWSAGQPMQCSLKGILCTLLHQLLEGQRAIAMVLCTEVPLISNKDSHNDWSVTELKDFLFRVLDQHSSPICIFLDGLDEISQAEGTFDLVDLVEKLRDRPKVKICVSSRPERHLQSCLGKYPSLRLQDLTASDIRQYVTDFLDGLSGQIREHEDSRISLVRLIDSVVKKSDGIFLWVHLALASLRRGMTSGDEWSELRQRLEILPRGLQQLYQQMWLRLNEDEEIYRTEASFYFNMAIEAISAPASGPAHKAISLYDFAILTDDTLQRVFLEEDNPPPEEKMVKVCRRLRTRVEVRCAGLLEFHPNMDSLGIIIKAANPKAVLEEDDARIVQLDFIHRTARDFLLQTEEGQTILHYDPMPIEQRYTRVIRMQLSRIIWQKTVRDLSRFISQLRSARRPVSVAREQELLHIYERMTERRYLIPDLDTRSYRARYIKVRRGGGDFLGVAAMFGCLELIQRKLAGAQATIEYKTYLLHRASCWPCGFELHTPRDSKTLRQTNGALIGWLLDNGADPNLRVYNPWQPSYWRSAFAGLLDNALFGRLRRYRDVDEFREELLNIVEIFLAHDADLSSTTYLAANSRYNYEFYARDWVVVYSEEHWGRFVLLEVNVAELFHMAIISCSQTGDAAKDNTLDDWSHRITCQRYRKVSLVCGRCKAATVTNDDSSYILEALDTFQAAMSSNDGKTVESVERLKEEVGRRIDQSFETGKKVDPKEFLRKKKLMASEATVDRSPPEMSLR